MVEGYLEQNKMINTTHTHTIITYTQSINYISDQPECMSAKLFYFYFFVIIGINAISFL